MRRPALLAVAAVVLLGLGGCYANPGDADTGWAANRPRCMPCEGCCSLVPDPVVFGRECSRSTCCPDLPGRLVATSRHNQHPLPGTSVHAHPGPIVHVAEGGVVPR